MKMCIPFLMLSFFSSYAQQSISYDEFVNRIPNLTEQDKEDYKSYPELLDLEWAMIKMMACRTLASLGYGTGPFVSDYTAIEKDAIRRFQGDMGQPVTGTLDSLTVANLSVAEDFFLFSNTGLPMKYMGADQDLGYAHATGTWKAVNFEAAWPFNTEYLWCEKATMTCESYTTNIERQKDFVLDNSKTIITNHSVFTVVRWDEEFILAESEAACAKTVLSLNLVTKDVTLTRYTTSTDGLCAGMDTELLFSTLISGIDLRTDVRWKRYYEITRKNSDYQKVIEMGVDVKGKYHDDD